VAPWPSPRGRGYRRHNINLLDLGDALAPGLVLAQAIGRWGNYFNQELYGRPTTLPWALQIDPAHRPRYPSAIRPCESPVATTSCRTELSCDSLTVLRADDPLRRREL
jgi:prolipoprotein diacylglyceryltransferase